MSRTQQYADDEILEALQLTKGKVYDAADVIGCCADTIYERAKSCPAILTAMKHARGKFLDKCEGKLEEAVDAGEQWAINLSLKTLGRERGYWDKTEQQHSGPVEIKTVTTVRPSTAKPLDANGFLARQSLNGTSNGTNGHG